MSLQRFAIARLHPPPSTAFHLSSVFVTLAGCLSLNRSTTKGFLRPYPTNSTSKLLVSLRTSLPFHRSKSLPRKQTNAPIQPQVTTAFASNPRCLIPTSQSPRDIPHSPVCLLVFVLLCLFVFVLVCFSACLCAAYSLTTLQKRTRFGLPGQPQALNPTAGTGSVSGLTTTSAFSRVCMRVCACVFACRACMF